METRFYLWWVCQRKMTTTIGNDCYRDPCLIIDYPIEMSLMSSHLISFLLFFCIHVLLYAIYNNSRLLKAIGGCNGTMRAMVPGRYFQLYNDNLEKVMKKECGNKPFGSALQYLALDPVHAECEMIEDACKGFGTNESFLLAIICGRSNKEVEILKVGCVLSLFSFHSDIIVEVSKFVFGKIPSIL